LTPWIAKPVPFNIGQGAAAAAASQWPDSVGSDGDGTVDGMVIDTSDQKLGDGCGSFDGSNDKVAIPAAVMDEIADGDFTISMWINRNANQDAFIGSSSPYWESHVPASNKVVMELSSTYTGSTVTSTSTWYLVIIRRTSDTVTMYVDNSDQSVSTSTDSTDLSGAFDFGERGSYWNGLIDDAAIWKTSISTALMTEIYNSGSGETIANLSDKEGIVAYYNFDSITGGKLINNAV